MSCLAFLVFGHSTPLFTSGYRVKTEHTLNMEESRIEMSQARETPPDYNSLPAYPEACMLPYPQSHLDGIAQSCSNAAGGFDRSGVVEDQEKQNRDEVHEPEATNGTSSEEEEEEDVYEVEDIIDDVFRREVSTFLTRKVIS
ncbi:hypothetical protein BJ684DRAFT_21897 [Piptocephalis cylindrospora]|uniref:Uncharacterized protein n=1 Tax=Piptocephalis cylindrospora TaxID=1907219 RepID=A0A4P9XYL7_9FUNG|nr:hypothetical protein BJ684DRAFT_21897 [Piptocephalis cylindrospora]|eukprot:RKP11525.1 hypothetical protein BJ684DRAFT_21897 [Piptocephalis cylindrospora]